MRVLIWKMNSPGMILCCSPPPILYRHPPPFSYSILLNPSSAKSALHYCDPAASAMACSLALANDLFSPCLPFCEGGCISANVQSTTILRHCSVRVTIHGLVAFRVTSLQGISYLPLCESKVHLSSSLGDQSLVLLERSAHNAGCDREVAVVAAITC